MAKGMHRPIAVAAALSIAAGAVSGLIAIKPALAEGLALVTCSVSGGPCQQYKNLLAGSGIEGDDAKGTGVKGTASNAGTTGVFGSNNKGVGVKGTSTSAQGLLGTSSAYNGVEGDSSSGDGVFGNSTNGLGVYGVSTNSDGMLAFSYGPAGLYADNAANGFAIEAHGAGSGASIYAYPFGGAPAGYFDATANTGFGTITYSSGAPAQWAYNLNGNGDDISGTYIGIIGRATAGSGFPLVATDLSGNNLFWVDGNGNVFSHGSYNNFLRVRGGGNATAFGSSTTSPTVEDNGTAQLVDGTATVRLDPTFAATIDTSRAYQVMLTPDGDTHGLYVASKSPNGFVVREVEGGRGSISFDYHIYAPALGQSNARMTLVTHPMAAMPKSALVHPAIERSSRAPIRH